MRATADRRRACPPMRRRAATRQPLSAHAAHRAVSAPPPQASLPGRLCSWPLSEAPAGQPAACGRSRHAPVWPQHPAAALLAAQTARLRQVQGLVASRAQRLAAPADAATASRPLAWQATRLPQAMLVDDAAAAPALCLHLGLRVSGSPQAGAREADRLQRLAAGPARATARLQQVPQGSSSPDANLPATERLPRLTAGRPPRHAPTAHALAACPQKTLWWRLMCQTQQASPVVGCQQPAGRHAGLQRCSAGLPGPRLLTCRS
jgi:hypothetical protein